VSKYSSQLDLHVDIRNIFLCHPARPFVNRALYAFETMRAMIHAQSALPNRSCDHSVGDYDNSPLFRIFVNLFAVALNISGFSLMQRFCTTKVPNHEDAFRASMMFLKLCQGLIGLEASGMGECKYILEEQQLITLPPLCFGREQLCETHHSESAYACFVPVVPKTHPTRWEVQRAL
jgi:hypothetical protein